MTDINEQKTTLSKGFSSVGITGEHLLALYFPRNYIDTTPFLARPNYQDEQFQGIVTFINQPAKIAGRGPQRYQAAAIDTSGHPVKITCFGHYQQYGDFQAGSQWMVVGKIAFFHEQPSITISNAFPAQIGFHPDTYDPCAVPVYSGKAKRIRGERIRDELLANLSHYCQASTQYLCKHHLDASYSKQIFQTLQAVHHPNTPDQGWQAQAQLRSLAAVALIQQTERERNQRQLSAPLPGTPSFDQVRQRIEQAPFPLTREQKIACRDIMMDMHGLHMHRLLTGDVGTGKTAVFLPIAAATYDAGGTVAILLPTTVLAEQCFQTLQDFYPDVPAQLVTGNRSPESDIRFLIGTTSLISQKNRHLVSGRHLLIVDEQQKFSREQRETLQPDHLLEVSATCIPRSQALISLGVADHSALRHQRVEKHIRTRIGYPQHRKAIYNQCVKTIEAGKQLAIIYALRENSEAVDRQDAQAAYDRWERQFPGRVRLIHGKMTDGEKQQAVQDMINDKADILISTTVVEVGLNIPKLAGMLVINPEAHGAETLHQLRGRLCRHGGNGWMTLYLTGEASPKTLERLNLLTQINDGFELAEKSLALRGAGELSGEKQHGESPTFIVNQPLEYADIQRGLELIKKQKEAPAHANA